MMTELPTIWFVGDSWVFWLESHARAQGDPNLSLPANVEWLGQRDMRWGQLIPLLESQKRLRVAPQVLLIHVGGNELGFTKGSDLIHRVKYDLALVVALFPGAQVVFSNICERRVRMRGTCDAPGRFNQARSHVNKAVDSYLRDMGMSFVRHTNLRRSMPVFRRDGVHLNPLGNSLLMANIIDVVKLVL